MTSHFLLTERGVCHVVNHNWHVASCVEQLHDRVATDVAGTTSDQNVPLARHNDYREISMSLVDQSGYTDVETLTRYQNIRDKYANNRTRGIYAIRTDKRSNIKLHNC